MDRETELVNEIRTHIIGELHVGGLRPGARLASIREVAMRYRVDHRLAARAYETLQTENLVEIRGRSGVFVARADSARERVLDGRQNWVADVLRQAWDRRVTLPELQNMMRRTSMHGLTCLCVESTKDHLVAIASELAADFGFRITPIQFMADSAGEPEPGELARMAGHLNGIDIIATTAFHSRAIAKLASDNGKEFLPITVNGAVRASIAKILRDGPVRVVIADPLFGARAVQFLPEELRSQLEIVLAADYNDAPNDGVPTIFTKAARREMNVGEADLLSGALPFISPESVEQVCALIARIAIAG